MMAAVPDSSSLGSFKCFSDISQAFLAAQIKLNAMAKAILLELDEFEAISVLFLVLDVEHLTRHGFKYCQYISTGSAEVAVDQIIRGVREAWEGLVDPLLEALYVVGRYDLLEDQLRLPVDENVHQHFDRKSILEDDRKALYCVFAGMAQEQADELLQNKRLSDWSCLEVGRPMEETFVRSLRPGNYRHLLSQLFQALIDEDRTALAAYLYPFVSRTASPATHCQFVGEVQSRNLYPLPTGYPHGVCIIINIKSFIKPRSNEEDFPLAVRHGSDLDKQRLEGTFKLFGFHVKILDNPDYEALQHYFKQMRTHPGLAGASCLAVCVMTHGDREDNIYLHDRSCISLTHLRELSFTQTLLNKPRLFFVQACRGEQALRPILLQKDTCMVTHIEGDCIISSATVKGHSALRSQREGSWYITDLCQALQTYGHLMPIKNVLQITRQQLGKRLDIMDNSYVTQLSEDKDTLTKDVQFVRADVEHFVEGILDLVHLETAEKVIEELIEVALFEQTEDQFTILYESFSA